MRRLRRGAILALVWVVSSAGCGTRVDEPQSLSASSQPIQPGETSQAGPSVDVGTGGPITGGAAGQPGAAYLPSSPRGASGAASKTPADGGSGRVPQTPEVKRHAPGAGTEPAPEAPANPSKKTELRVGSVGTLSGPIGATIGVTIEAVKLWVRMTNDRGGLDGRFVRFSAADDGADPARHRALVQEMVERHHVIAFVQQILSPAGQGTMDYIEAKRVPIIGTDVGSQWIYDSPMVFPQVPSGDAVYLGHLYGLAEQVLPQGKKRLGWVVCAEVESVCGRVDRILQEHVGEAGFELAYRAKTSIVQPDYTAECLAARQAQVEAFMIYLDANAIERFANSCARQGFRPTYSAAGSLIFDRFRENPNLEGFVGPLNVFAPQQANTPATRQFQDAMTRYLPKRPREVAHATGWTSAKLFERAASGLPEPPSSESLLQRLWSIKADPIGGLSPAPLTFVEGRPATATICWYVILIRSRQWQSPSGYQSKCRK